MNDKDTIKSFNARYSKELHQFANKLKELQESIMQAAAALGKAWQKYWDSLPDNVKKKIMKDEE